MILLFFEQSGITFEIVNVFFFDQKNIKTKCQNRNYHAVALRLDSQAIIKTKDAQVELSSGALSFMPARLDYERISKKDKFLVVDFCSKDIDFGDIEYFYPENTEKYRVLFEKAHRIWSQKKTGYRYMAASVFREILAEAHKDTTITELQKSGIYQSVKYIDDNMFKTDFNLSSAGNASYMSEVYFRRLFKKEFGISPKRYVINKRMEYAISLINSGYYPLKEIGFMCGYRDYKYFSVEFKKATGKSPSEYIK